MNDAHLHRRLVAQGPMCRIEDCSCGTLHVTIGALTIRVQPEALASAFGTVGEALDELARRKVSDRHVRRRDELPS